MSNTVATTHHQVNSVQLSREQPQEKQQQAPSNLCAKQFTTQTFQELTPKSKVDSVIMHSTKFMEDIKARRQIWSKKPSVSNEHVRSSSIAKLPPSRRRNFHIASISSSNSNMINNGNKIQEEESTMLHEELEKRVIEAHGNEENANTTVSVVVMEHQPIPAQRVIAIGKKHHQPDAPHFTTRSNNNNIDKSNSLPINTTIASAAGSSVSTIASHRQVKMTNTQTRPSAIRASATRERNVQSTVSSINHTSFTSTSYNHNSDIDGVNTNKPTQSHLECESKSKRHNYSHTSPESIILVKTSTTSRVNENSSEASLHTSPSSSPRSLLSSANNFSHPLGKKIFCIRANDNERVDSHVSPFAIASGITTKNNIVNGNNCVNGANTLSASHNSLMSSRSNTVASLGKMRTKAPVTMRKIINLSLCRYSLLRIVAKNMNFTVEESEEELNEFNFNLCWSDTVLPLTRIVRFANWQRTNHFPSMYLLCRKSHLGRTIGALRNKLPHEYNFYPRTWMMRCEAVFFTQFYDMLQQRHYKHPHYFIMKPNAGCQGRGIIVTKDPLHEVEELHHYIVQEYIARPMLIEGRKFDLRIYVLLTSIRNMSIFLFNDGLVRISAATYEEPTDMNIKNNCMHLTNYAINKKSAEYVYNNDASRFDVGNKRNFRFFNKWLQEQGHDVTLFWKHVSQIVVKTIVAAQPQICSVYDSIFPANNEGYSCFEVLGFDILIDRNAKPWLMEVNHTPSFATDTPLDFDIKSRLIRETLEIVNCRAEDAQRDKVRARAEFTKRHLPPWTTQSSPLRPMASSSSSTGFYQADKTNSTSSNVYKLSNEDDNDENDDERDSVDDDNDEPTSPLDLYAKIEKEMELDENGLPRLVQHRRAKEDKKLKNYTRIYPSTNAEEQAMYDACLTEAKACCTWKAIPALQQNYNFYRNNNNNSNTCNAMNSANINSPNYRSQPIWPAPFYATNMSAISANANRKDANIISVNKNSSSPDAATNDKDNVALVAEATNINNNNIVHDKHLDNTNNNNDENSKITKEEEEKEIKETAANVITETPNKHAATPPITISENPVKPSNQLCNLQISVTEVHRTPQKRQLRRRNVNTNYKTNGGGSNSMNTNISSLSMTYSHRLLDSRLKEDKTRPRYLPHTTQGFLTSSFAESHSGYSSRASSLTSAMNQEQKMATMQLEHAPEPKTPEMKMHSNFISNNNNNNHNNNHIMIKADDCVIISTNNDESISNYRSVSDQNVSLTNHTTNKDVVEYNDHIDSGGDNKELLKEPEPLDVAKQHEHFHDKDVVRKKSRSVENANKEPSQQLDEIVMHDEDNKRKSIERVTSDHDNTVGKQSNKDEPKMAPDPCEASPVGQSSELIMHTPLEVSEPVLYSSPPQHVRYSSIPTEEELQWLTSLQEQLDNAANDDPVPAEHGITDLTE